MWITPRPRPGLLGAALSRCYHVGASGPPPKVLEDTVALLQKACFLPLLRVFTVTSGPLDGLG